jgi:hypothetical protein
MVIFMFMEANDGVAKFHCLWDGLGCTDNDRQNQTSPFLELSDWDNFKFDFVVLALCRFYALFFKLR